MTDATTPTTTPVEATTAVAEAEPKPKPAPQPEPEPQQPLTTEPEVLEVPENLFLIHPANAHIIEGEAERKLPPIGARVGFLVGIPLVLIAAGLTAYTVARWNTILPLMEAGTTALPDTVGNGILWTVWAGLMWIISIGFYISGLTVLSKRRALAKRGEILFGEVTGSSRRIDRFDDLRVSVAFRFQRPRRFRWQRRRFIEGEVSEDRNDLREKALPSPGTPVAILYLNHENYEVL